MPLLAAMKKYHYINKNNNNNNDIDGADYHIAERLLEKLNSMKQQYDKEEEGNEMVINPGFQRYLYDHIVANKNNQSNESQQQQQQHRKTKEIGIMVLFSNWRSSCDKINNISSGGLLYANAGTYLKHKDRFEILKNCHFIFRAGTIAVSHNIDHEKVGTSSTANTGQIIFYLIGYISQTVVKELSISVITPYSTQVDNLLMDKRKYFKNNKLNISIGTTTKAQGREYDIVIDDLCRRCSTPFLDDISLFNFAVTRSRMLSIILKHSSLKHGLTTKFSAENHIINVEWHDLKQLIDSTQNNNHTFNYET